MAQITRPQQKHYDVLAEALTADGRVVKRVEARADDLRDVAEAFRLAAAEARQAHLTPARIRLSASRAGTTEVSATLEESEDPLAKSALLDGKTKLDALPVSVPNDPSFPMVTCGRCGTPGVRGKLHVCIPLGLAPGSGSNELYRLLKLRLPGWGVHVGYDLARRSYVVTAVPGPVTFEVAESSWDGARDQEGIARVVADRLARSVASHTQP